MRTGRQKDYSGYAQTKKDAEKMKIFKELFALAYFASPSNINNY